MADYKRLVSYIYNYENGQKRGNIGFSRVEAKNGKCKVTIHFKTLALDGRDLKVYFLLRKNEMLRGIKLGTVAPKNGTGEFRIETESENLMNSGYPIEQICGVLVYASSEKFLGSQWDDLPIDLRNFSECNEVQKKDERLLNQIEQKISDYIEEEVKSEVVELKASELEQEDIISKDTIDLRLQEVVNILNESKEVEKPEEKIYECPIEKAETDQDIEKQEMELQEMENDANEPESITENENVPEVEQQSCCQKERKCCPEPEVDWYPECVKRIIETYPEISKFPKKDFKVCVKMEPRDIGVFPIETWILANNSFLLHGYYNYRHIMFGVLVTSGELQYVIGVPGIFHNREQMMAGMFGFDRFKSIKGGNPAVGDFGYWVQQIIL
ncbi:DUF6128 domain-containing protein [Anaeromicropila populeti]|uniref:DUF6128 domain-containing protein n=1 Tax=Anaeromicropila populeti TaxID=37658 RepID=A0A1I6LGY6_9FIRM|nr:DUF6128 domain-containing protein [Anaeromicropila populeti]SFS02674.1 hypothetical protein SAMN05661086_03290 [Anaeromicropila populeti]